MRPAHVAAGFAIFETLAHARYLNGSIEATTVLRSPIRPTHNPYASEPVAALSMSSTLSARTVASTSSTSDILFVVPYVPPGSTRVYISTVADLSTTTTTTSTADLNTPNALSVLLSALPIGNPTVAASADGQSAISSTETLLSTPTAASSTSSPSQIRGSTTTSVPLVIIPPLATSNTPNALSVLVPARSTYTESYQTYFTGLPSPSSSGSFSEASTTTTSSSEPTGITSQPSGSGSTGTSMIASSSSSTEIYSASSSPSTKSTKDTTTSTQISTSTIMSSSMFTSTRSSTKRTSTTEPSTATSTATAVPAAPPAGAAVHSHGFLPGLVGMLCLSWSLLYVL